MWCYTKRHEHRANIRDGRKNHTESRAKQKNIVQCALIRVVSFVRMYSRVKIQIEPNLPENPVRSSQTHSCYYSFAFCKKCNSQIILSVYFQNFHLILNHLNVHAPDDRSIWTHLSIWSIWSNAEAKQTIQLLIVISRADHKLRCSFYLMSASYSRVSSAWNENTNIWNSHIKIFWAWIVFPIRKWKCSHFNNFSATVRIVRRQQREREANLPGTERLVTKTTRDTCELYSRNRIEKKQRIVVGFESVNWYSWREHINLLLLHVEIRPEFSHND